MTRSVSAIFPQPEGLKSEYQKFFRLLAEAKNILISSTLTSDGDSIGSQIGIYHLIRKLRADSMPKVTIINESPVPHRYSFLNHSNLIQTHADYKKQGLSESFDLGITTDGGIERTGSVEDEFKNVASTVLVDHHAVGSELAYSAKILDQKASSTCEIVYDLFEASSTPIDKDVAEHLYVGIIFDTGFFKHSLTTPKTLCVASNLIETGIDFSSIADQAILERSWGGQLLMKKMLENMWRSESGKLVSSHWSFEELGKIDYLDGDSEGLINQLYYTMGCEAVALFVETAPQQIKVSFRSKGAVNVAEFARSLNPQGGGHVRASGCSLEGDLLAVKKEVLEKLNALL